MSLINQPRITIGIMEGQAEISGSLHGDFLGQDFGPVTGQFSAIPSAGMVVLTDEIHREIVRSAKIRLAAGEGSTFKLSHVTIGHRFHWERTEDQTFQGDLVLQHRSDGMIAAMNEILLEDYLKSVISSEMSGAAPIEFLKAHAILSRSWLLATLEKKRKAKQCPPVAGGVTEGEGEVVRWYDREDHELFDVCADDHCQRYQGITKVLSSNAEDAVRDTGGVCITYQGELCDARYSKACGGLTENFETAWGDEGVPYLRSVSDAPFDHPAIKTEEEARRWILSEPRAYCHTEDEDLLGNLLPGVDRETKKFFRWKTDYSRKELEEILREKSGFDFGTLEAIVPLRRGPSGRISRLKIVGSKRSMMVGKELEIRRWFSRTHLYSSAFTVQSEGDRITFYGAGWGHGVGLCQIGAGVMASRGFSAEQILKHYFRGVDIQKIY